MTKSKGIMIGILLLLIAVLTGIMVWGIARGGGLRVELGKFFSGDAKLVNEQSIDTEGLQEVSVIYRSADLVLTVSDTNALTIEEYMTGDPGEENFADIQRDDAAGSLSVTEGKSYTAVSFLSFGSGQQYVEIGVPEDYRGTLRLKTGSGNIMLTELNMEQLDISADSGDITLLDTGATPGMYGRQRECEYQRFGRKSDADHGIGRCVCKRHRGKSADGDGFR